MKEEFEKELHELSPLLADLKNRQQREPFRTPRLYFDTLADKVLENAKTETAVAAVPPQYKSPITPFHRLNNWLSTIIQPRLAWSACALALFVGAGWYVVNQQNRTPAVPSNTDTAATQEAQKDFNTPIEDFKKGDTYAVAETPSKKMGDEEAIKKDAEPNLPTLNGQEEQRTQKTLAHPQSGLTEEELEEYLKENLTENDIEALGGK